MSVGCGSPHAISSHSIYVARVALSLMRLKIYCYDCKQTINGNHEMKVAITNVTESDSKHPKNITTFF